MMNALYYSSGNAQDTITWTPRIVIMLTVFLLHLFTLFIWLQNNEQLYTVSKELSISFSPVAQPAIAQAEKSKPLTMPKPVPAPVIEPAQSDAAHQAAMATPSTPAVAPPAPEIAPGEPDYQAAYLNNPSPAYPLAARRMGMQGRVVLNVEVLASGVCGEINIHQSSGFPVLDNAALQTVKRWRFLPASRAGHALDKWFMIPVHFSLKDNKA